MSKKKKPVPPELKAGWTAHDQEMIKLREQWPKAFPRNPERIRPLIVHALGIIAKEMNWSVMYTRGVLQPWKKRAAYCKAVLRDTHRINLDGSKSAETISDDARKDAQAQLDALHKRAETSRQVEILLQKMNEMPEVENDEAA